MRQQGFTLVEVVLVAAIVMVAAAVLGFAFGSRPLALRSSATQFDAALAYGKALAATGGNGATLVFEPAARGSTITLYQGRPTVAGALRPAAIPPFSLDADVREASLGSPPFALFLSGAGRASMAKIGAGATPAPLATEPACPATGAWNLLFRADGAKEESHVLACSTGGASP